MAEKKRKLSEIDKELEALAKKQRELESEKSQATEY